MVSFLFFVCVCMRPIPVTGFILTMLVSSPLLENGFAFRFLCINDCDDLSRLNRSRLQFK